VAWYLTLGVEARADVVDRVPSGAGGRARNAGLAFAALIALAWIGLPIAYHGWRATGRAVRWCATKGGAARVALLPVQGLAALGSLSFGALFLATALAVLAAAAATLLAAAWIVRPELFGGQAAVWGS